MIDLHFHLLPGIDDGPATIEAALALASMAVADGVDTVVATPHLRADHPRVKAGELAARVAAVQEQLWSHRIGLRVITGAEVDLLWAREASGQDLELASLGQAGHDILLETPYGTLSSLFEGMVAEIAAKGYRITLAHPERNASFQRRPERLELLIDSGVLMQLSAGSLLGRKSNPERRLAWRLLEGGRAHVLASDAHTTEPWRRPNLSAGVAALTALSSSLATWMVTDAPGAILAGLPLPPPPEVRATGVRALLRPRRMF